MLKKLTPITRGWAAYYRTEVSSEVFSALDDYRCLTEAPIQLRRAGSGGFSASSAC